MKKERDKADWNVSRNPFCFLIKAIERLDLILIRKAHGLFVKWFRNKLQINRLN